MPVMSEYTADEMMTVAAARALADGAVCFVGIGLPSTAVLPCAGDDDGSRR